MSIDRIKKEKIKYNLPVLVSVIMIFALLLLPTGFEGAVNYKGAEHCSAKVLNVYDDRIISTGLVKSGEQTCTVEFLGGKFKGEEAEGFNLLNGSLESDKIFKPGDKALVIINYEGGEILSVNLIDHYRMNYEAVLAVGFALFLILFAGKTGIRAILSFAITILSIWKILVPAFLKGYNPVFWGLTITILLTIIIIALDYGFDRKCLAAVSGAICYSSLYTPSNL